MEEGWPQGLDLAALGASGRVGGGPWADSAWVPRHTPKRGHSALHSQCMCGLDVRVRQTQHRRVWGMHLPDAGRRHLTPCQGPVALVHHCDSHQPLAWRPIPQPWQQTGSPGGSIPGRRTWNRAEEQCHCYGCLPDIGTRRPTSQPDAVRRGLNHPPHTDSACRYITHVHRPTHNRSPPHNLGGPWHGAGTVRRAVQWATRRDAPRRILLRWVCALCSASSADAALWHPFARWRPGPPLNRSDGRFKGCGGR